MVESKVMPSNRYTSLARPDLMITEYRFSSTPCKRASGNSSMSFTGIQRSNQKLWPFRTVSLAWRDQTSSSPSIDSSSTACKRASRNSSKSLTGIQRSNQKLWPFQTVTQAWRDQTSSSPSIDSSSTPCKRASRKSSKSLTAIQRSHQKLWPFRIRYSSLERPDLIITEYPFLIHSMKKSIRKLE